ncbi:MAG TPA: hypothetical protein VJ924_15365 [Alphaproteobacteria bacterium]|nr:hypothetical protein [Alphaproteobacteria bacterium]
MNPKKIASPLSRKATLVTVDISQWTARKLDKKVTDKINRDHNAASDAGRYHKLLIEAKRLEAINSIVAKARRLHYTMTKPWCDEGVRILPNLLHEKFATEFRKLKREFDAAADDFCADYPRFIEERRRALNGLFDASDYPHPNEIRSKFRLNTKTFPVPEADDFRSDVLDAETVEDIRRELIDTSDAVLADAMKHTGKQIAEVVGHMAAKLKDYKKAGAKSRSFFSHTLVENVRELADLLPAFNLDNDPGLDAIAARIKKELCAEDAETLRENDTVRKSVAKSADDILRDVESLLG